MSAASAVRLAIALLVSLGVAFALAAAVAPPDPLTQLLVVGGLMVIAVPLVSYLEYRSGYDALQRKR